MRVFWSLIIFLFCAFVPLTGMQAVVVPHQYAYLDIGSKALALSGGTVAASTLIGTVLVKKNVKQGN
jgi:hypothetical protein